MAPEVYADANPHLTDLRDTDLSKVDTFALAVIIINMLTGRYLFDSCLDSAYIEIYQKR